MTDKTTIIGIGWVDNAGYGCMGTHLSVDTEDSDAHSVALSSGSCIPIPRGVGRFDATTRVTYIASALALHDSGINTSKENKTDIGIINTNVDSCFDANIKYFRDYVECGSIMARGNLFIYTLPTSPLAETAIQFGLQGPMYYLAGPDTSLATLLYTADGTIQRGETSGMLIVDADDRHGLCLMLSAGKEDQHHGLCSMCGAARALDVSTNMRDRIAALRQEIGHNT